MSHTSDSLSHNMTLVDTTIQSTCIDTAYIHLGDTAIHTACDSCTLDRSGTTIEIHDGLDAMGYRLISPLDDDGMFVLIAIEIILFILFVLHRKKIFSWQDESDSLYTHNHNRHLSGINTRLRNIFLLFTFLIEGTLCTILFHSLRIPLLLQNGYAINALILSIPFALYFALQQGIYLLLSAIFAPDMRGREWCGSHIIINLFLGLVLFPLILLSTYIPESNFIALWLWGILYISSRILFIIKSVKLFLQNFRGLLYFILYLCALEIAPILLIMTYAGVFQ